MRRASQLNDIQETRPELRTSYLTETKSGKASEHTAAQDGKNFINQWNKDWAKLHSPMTDSVGSISQLNATENGMNFTYQ
jgi:hypothetical protein